jgi:hypothetical protein
VAAKDLEHPRRIAVAGLGQDGENVRPLEADVPQETVIQFAEDSYLPAVPDRMGEAEEGWEEARHLSLLLIFPVK